jgi:DNA-directed RNA polymerase subunit RPC12/RpoP
MELRNCSFCGKDERQVEILIACPEGSNKQETFLLQRKDDEKRIGEITISVPFRSYICDRCVWECTSILNADKRVPVMEQQY